MQTLTAIIATDFSPEAKLITPTLTALQHTHALQLNLIYVLASYWKNWFHSGLPQKEALRRLQLFYTTLTGSTPDTDQLFVPIGNPGDCIISLAKLLQPSYVFIGGAKTAAASRYPIAHTLLAVARSVAQSVWVCKSTTISHILCGIDGSRHSAKALAKAIELARLFRARLSIVAVIERIDFNPLGLSSTEIAAHEQRIEQQHRQHLAQFLHAYDFNSISTTEFYPWGTPGEVILDMAEDMSVDLIVLGTCGHSRLRHALIGGVTQTVLRHTPCSLLIVR